MVLLLVVHSGGERPIANRAAEGAVGIKLHSPAFTDFNAGRRNEPHGRCLLIGFLADLEDVQEERA